MRMGEPAQAGPQFRHVFEDLVRLLGPDDPESLLPSAAGSARPGADFAAVLISLRATAAGAAAVGPASTAATTVTAAPVTAAPVSPPRPTSLP